MCEIQPSIRHMCHLDLWCKTKIDLYKKKFRAENIFFEACKKIFLSKDKRQLDHRVSTAKSKQVHFILSHYRALVRTGATGAWAPVNFGQRVPGTRQFLMFNLFMRLILVKLVKKFGNFSFANNCAPVNWNPLRGACEALVLFLSLFVGSFQKKS